MVVGGLHVVKLSFVDVKTNSVKEEKQTFPSQILSSAVERIK